MRQRLRVASGLASRPLLLRGIQTVTTFHLAVFAWIFFRANDVGDAFFIVGEIFRSGLAVPESFGLGLSIFETEVAAFALTILALVHLLDENGYPISERLGAVPGPLRWAAYYCILAFVLLFAYSGPDADFIYFQF